MGMDAATQTALPDELMPGVEDVHRDHAVPAPLPSSPQFHHVGVQTTDLDNCMSWYQDFFGGRPTWTLGTFSDLTRSRLPGITRLTEMVVGGFRVHLFERDPERGGGQSPGPRAAGTQFQHICIRVGSREELERWCQHWRRLFASGRYEFAVPEEPTDIVSDEDGVDSFYALDVNGLEYEFTYIPDGGNR